MIRTIVEPQQIRGRVENILATLARGGLISLFIEPSSACNLSCKFCDFAAICRARESSFGKMESPMAEWSREHMATGLEPAFQHLKKVRGFEE